MMTLEQCLGAHRPIIFTVAESDVEVLRHLNENYKDASFIVYSTTLAALVPLNDLLDGAFAISEARATSTIDILNTILNRRFDPSNSRFEKYVFLDAQNYITDPQNIRKIKDIVSRYQLDVTFTVNLIFVTSSVVVPQQLERLSEVVFFDLPNEAKLKEASDVVVKRLELNKETAPSDEVLNNLKGLTQFEVEQAYLQSFHIHKRIDLNFIREFKKSAISKTDLLSLMETDVTFDQIGGMGTLKDWVMMSFGGWTVEGKKFGLPLLKGLLMVGLPGCGKAQPLDSPIMTPTGIKKMGDMREGSIVCTPNGKNAKVLKIFPQGEVDIFRVYFEDGSSTECCRDHLWRVKIRDRRHQADSWIVPVSYLFDKVKDKYGSNNISIETPTKVSFSKKELLIDPYIMGLLIGDGTLGNEQDFENARHLGFTSADESIIIKLRTYIKKDSSGEYILKKLNTHKYGYSIRRKNRSSKPNKYTEILKKYGIWGKKSEYKFIPEDYLTSSHYDRVKLLKGLMDTDGGISRNGMNPDFSTSSSRLSEDFKFLVESLGGVCTITSRIPYYKDKNGQRVPGLLAYRCWLKINLNPFLLKRKKDRVIKRTKYQKLYRIIEKFEYVGKKEAQCIALDDTYNLYMTDNFIVTHNSLLAKALGNMWHLPLVQFDPSRLFSSRVGDTESNMRRVLKIVENMSPCILFVDEMEKGFFRYAVEYLFGWRHNGTYFGVFSDMVPGS
jgi:hypothetical protein